MSLSGQSGLGWGEEEAANLRQILKHAKEAHEPTQATHLELWFPTAGHYQVVLSDPVGHEGRGQWDPEWHSRPGVEWIGVCVLVHSGQEAGMQPGPEDVFGISHTQRLSSRACDTKLRTALGVP